MPRFVPQILFLLVVCVVRLQAEALEPIDADWLRARLAPDRPRLVWQEGDEERIRALFQGDAGARALYELILEQADGMLDLPALEREQVGRRILGVSRNALKRSTCLAFAWRMTGERAYLERLETLLDAVSGFADWNPSHFLDTAEMSLAVALALDWTAGALSPDTRARAEEALRDCGLLAGESSEAQWAFEAENNWNQVCNAGMVAAALVLAEREPEMAARVLNRMLATLPLVLATYAPDGVYAEGAMYWSYGTEFNVVLFDILDTALGTDFGLPSAEGFMDSADFPLLLRAPSGLYYDFYDSSLESGFEGALLWFAKETGDPRYALREELRALPQWDLDPASLAGRLLPIEMLWLARFEPAERAQPLPLNWVGQGENPIGIFRSSLDDPRALYLAFKGGRGSNNHGNLDAGSFILELDGARWSVDPGNQSYHELEQYFREAGGELWSAAQDSARWQLLTKNNFGHSTIVVDGELHRADGKGEIVAFDERARVARLDLSAPLGPKAIEAIRIFSAPDDRTVIVEDRLHLAEDAREARWQMLTQAERVTLYPGGAMLEQDGERLELEVLSPEGAQVSVTDLQLPPHPMDKRMENLKRIDIVAPRYLGEDGRLSIVARLSGPPR